MTDPRPWTEEELRRLVREEIAAMPVGQAVDSRLSTAEQREREARGTAEEWRQEANDMRDALDRVRAERNKSRRQVVELHDALCRPGQPPEHDFFGCAMEKILEMQSPPAPDPCGHDEATPSPAESTAREDGEKGVEGTPADASDAQLVAALDRLIGKSIFEVGSVVAALQFRGEPAAARQYIDAELRRARDIGRQEGAEPYVAWFRKYGEALVKHVQISGLDEFLALLAKAKESR